MEDMEKKTEEMAETGEVEMTQRMAERAGWIDTQTYWYLMQLLELNVDQAKQPENDGYRQEAINS